MKKFFSLLVAFISVIAFWSCGPVTPEGTFEQYLETIYTVKKSAAVPEFEDTAFYVKNIDEYGLVTGDRVHMGLHYYYDAYSGKKGEWNIVKMVRKIPVRSIVARENIETSEYDMPFEGLVFYELFDSYLWPDWIWENRLNINVGFKAPAEKTQIEMVMHGVANDTIKLHLVAKSDENSNIATTQLLTYNLEDIPSLLTEEEKDGLKEYEKLNFRIYYKLKDGDKLKDTNFTIKRGEFKNPLYN